MIDVESYIVFLAAMGFTVLWWANPKAIVHGIIGSLCWFTLGFMWLFLAAAAPSYSTYAVGLIFNGIGIIFTVYILIQLIAMRNVSRELGETGEIE